MTDHPAQQDLLVAKRRALNLIQLLVLFVLAGDDDLTDEVGTAILDDPFVTFYVLCGLADACWPIVRAADPAPDGVPVLCWAILQAHAYGEHDRARTMTAALVTGGLGGARAVVDTLSFLASVVIAAMQEVPS